MIHNESDWGVYHEPSSRQPQRRRQLFNFSPLFKSIWIRYLYILEVFIWDFFIFLYKLQYVLYLQRKQCNLCNFYKAPRAFFSDVVTSGTRWIDFLELREKRNNKKTHSLFSFFGTESDYFIFHRNPLQKGINHWIEICLDSVAGTLPLSARLNTSRNEWRRLSRTLIIKIRIVTLFWTCTHADPQGLSLSLFREDVSPPLEKLRWENDRMMELLESRIRATLTNNAWAPLALCCLVTVEAVSGDEMRTWVPSSLWLLYVPAECDRCHRGGLWNHVAEHQSVTGLCVHNNALSNACTESSVMEGQRERERKRESIKEVLSCILFLIFCCIIFLALRSILFLVLRCIFNITMYFIFSITLFLIFSVTLYFFVVELCCILFVILRCIFFVLCFLYFFYYVVFHF